MAVETFKSDQLSGRKFTTDDYGKVRFIHFTVNPTVTGDVNTTADLCKLPQGRVRVLPHLSKLFGGVFGAARVISIGHRTYEKSGGTMEPEDAAAFGSALDVSGATSDLKVGTARKFDLFSKAGATVCAKITGGTWPSGVKLEGYIAVEVD